MPLILGKGNSEHCQATMFSKLFWVKWQSKNKLVDIVFCQLELCLTVLGVLIEACADIVL